MSPHQPVGAGGVAIWGENLRRIYFEIRLFPPPFFAVAAKDKLFPLRWVQFCVRGVAASSDKNAERNAESRWAYKKMTVEEVGL